MLAALVAAALVVGGWSSDSGRRDASSASAEDLALSLLEMGEFQEEGEGSHAAGPEPPLQTLGGLPWGSDESAGWRFKWGRVFKGDGKSDRVILVQYMMPDEPDRQVILSEEKASFGPDNCRKSLDIEWPVWFCTSDRYRGRTYVYLIARTIRGWDDDQNRGGLVAEAPYNGFVAWSRIQVHDSNHTAGFFENIRLVTLDVMDQLLVVEYKGSRDESKVYLRMPRLIAKEKCMAHTGPLPPVWLCVTQPAAQLRVYARAHDGGRGALVAESS